MVIIANLHLESFDFFLEWTSKNYNMESMLTQNLWTIGKQDAPLFSVGWENSEVILSAVCVK